MDTRTSTLVIGAPATGDKYWPREDVAELLQQALINDHVIFPGPRRTGKTSLLLELERSSNVDAKYVFINAERFSTPAELIQGVAEKFASNDVAKRVLKAAKGNESKVRGLKIWHFGLDLNQGPAVTWETSANALLEALKAEKQRTVIMIDEFSIFVNALAKQNKDEAAKLLRWFREWRQRLVDSPVKFLLTGSIGIDTVLRRLKLGDTINDCRSVYMFPPEDDDAIQFLLRRARENDIVLDEGMAREIIRLLGPPWHYPLQIFLDEIRVWSRQKKRPATMVDLAEIYRERLVRNGNENVKHMWDKLTEIFDPAEAKFARALLRGMSASAEGFTRQEMENVNLTTFPPGGPENPADYDFVMNVLRHDGYLIQETAQGQRTRFTSNLLRDFWARQHA